MVMKRDGFRCVYCGKSGKHVGHLQVDHVIPIKHGGPTWSGNLVTACRDCNDAKAAGELHLQLLSDVTANAGPIGLPQLDRRPLPGVPEPDISSILADARKAITGDFDEHTARSLIRAAIQRGADVRPVIRGMAWGEWVHAMLFL